MHPIAIVVRNIFTQLTAQRTVELQSVELTHSAGKYWSVLPLPNLANCG